MQHSTITITLILCALHSALCTLHAAVPVRWTVDTSRVQTYQIDAYHGETLCLESSFFQSNGRPLAITGPAELYYQTNGMGAAWWTAPATVASNTISATFTPAIDPGARILTCFLGGTASTYRAAFRLRFAASPGPTPNLLPLPTVTYDARLNGTPTINGTNLIDYVIAASGAEVDPTVPDWAKQPNPPQSGTDENAVRAIVGSFASTGTVNRTLSVGDADTWTDATGCVWRASMGVGEWRMIGHVPIGYQIIYPPLFQDWAGDLWICASVDDRGEYQSSMFGAYGADDVTYLNFGDFAWDRSVCISNLVGRVALTNDVPTSPGDIGAAPASVADIVQAWQTYWDGDDVRVTVTNYYGNEDLPHLYIEQKMAADDQHAAAWFKTIWDETTRQAVITGRVAAVERELEHKADRAWGFYDSSTGEYSPDGYTQISSSNILISAGMAYQKTVTTDGEVWVLTATEPTAISGVTSNGFFRIEDGDGNALFEIVKGDKRTVGATAGSIRVTDDEVQIGYALADHSSVVISYTTDLKNGTWQTVETTWTGTSGAYTALVEKPDSPCAFFRATYEIGGETYIRNSVPVSTDRVVIGGRFYRVSVETVNGKELMVLTDDN